MSLLLKVLLVVLLLYLGVRYITKPFRDILKQAEEKRKEFYDQQQKNATSTSKTDDVGEYIDYEEIE